MAGSVKRAKAILWDVDGTLVDSEPLHEEAIATALDGQGIAVPDDMHAALVGRDAAALHVWCVTELGLALGLEDWLELKYRAYFDLLDRLSEREGAVELFLALRAAGRAQAVVSNSDRMIVQANLQASGLAVPGQVSVSRNDVRDGKPAPEPYLRAAWLLGIEVRDCVVVEDSATGARAGLAAGMRTLFWPQKEQTPPDGVEFVADGAMLAALLHEDIVK